MFKLVINKDEIEILIRTIGVPLGAFGLEKLLREANTTKEECIRLSSILEMKRHKQGPIEITMSLEDLRIIAHIFDVSIQIVGEGDMHPIVGYTWDQAISLAKKLNGLVQR